MGWDNYETTPLDRIHYDLGFEVPADVAGDERIGTYGLPGFRAVAVHCQGELRTIGRAWD
jgi:hypothetical protein